MGLRAPQELERVRNAPQEMPRVQAAQTASLDLAAPANNFLVQKALAEQEKYVKDNISIKKDSLAKIRSKYAVENATLTFKQRISALKGDNAIRSARGLMDEAIRSLDEMEAKAPDAMKQQVGYAKAAKINELENLMFNKINVETQKADVERGKAITKLSTMEAASKFLDPQGFKKDMAATAVNMFNTELAGGAHQDTATLAAEVASSNAVYEGVQFTLSQAATPDRVAAIRNYYDNVISTDNEIFITPDDRVKIEKAFASAASRSEDNLAYTLAKNAMERDGITLNQGWEYIFNNANGSSKVAQTGYALFEREFKSKQADIERNDRELFTNLTEHLRNGNIAQAMALMDGMSGEGRTKANEYIKKTNAGTASLYTDRQDYANLNNMLMNNPEQFKNLDLHKGYVLAPEVLRSMLGAQAALKRQDDDRNFFIDSGGVEGKALELTKNVAIREGIAVGASEQAQAQLAAFSRRAYYNVRAEHPNETNPAVILGLLEQRVKTDLVNEYRKSNWLGDAIKGIMPDFNPNEHWLTSRERRELRDSNQIPPERQTGIGAKRSKITGKVVQDPTPEQINEWVEGRRARGVNITKEQAKQEIIQLFESRLRTPDAQQD